MTHINDLERLSMTGYQITYNNQEETKIERHMIEKYGGVWSNLRECEIAINESIKKHKGYKHKIEQLPLHKLMMQRTRQHIGYRYTCTIPPKENTEEYALKYIEHFTLKEWGGWHDTLEECQKHAKMLETDLSGDRKHIKKVIEEIYCFELPFLKDQQYYDTVYRSGVIYLQDHDYDE